MTDELVESGDLNTLFECQMAIAERAGNLSSLGEFWPVLQSELHDAESSLPESGLKIFHPRTAGYAVTRDEIIRKLKFKEIFRGGAPSGKQLRIMCIGDYNTIGQPDNFLSYRSDLWGLLRQNNDVPVYFVGSKNTEPADTDWGRVEGANGDTSQIWSAVNQDSYQRYQPNIVIIMGGNWDIIESDDDDDDALDRAIRYLEKIVLDALRLCGDCAILVAQIPPLG